MYENWDTIAHEQVVPHRILVREMKLETLFSQKRIKATKRMYRILHKIAEIGTWGRVSDDNKHIGWCS